MDNNEEQLKQRLALLKLKGEYNGTPEDHPYDPMGRGASPQTALRFEALGNSFAYPDQNESLKQQGIYPVNPKFVGEDYNGSGTYEFTGPNEGAILLNVNKPWDYRQYGTEEVINHELRHKQSGSMGGVEWNNPNSENPKRLDNFIRSVESDEWRVPNERLAYGGNDVLDQNIRYYLPGDFQRILAGRRLGVKSK